MPAFGEFTKADRCPICREELEQWGDTTNYPEKSETEHWQCKSCDYTRDKLKRLKK